MVAPIALYPDSLLSQVLMAATYPADVAEAARWSKANAEQTGDAAVKTVDAQPPAATPRCSSSPPPAAVRGRC